MKKIITIIIIFLLIIVGGCEFDDDYDEATTYKHYQLNSDYSFTYNKNNCTYYYIKCLNYGYCLNKEEYGDNYIVLQGLDNKDYYLDKRIDDISDSVFYDYYTFYDDYVLFHHLWIKDELQAPDEYDDIKITKTIVTLVPDVTIIKEYEEIPFTNLFEEINDVSFIFDGQVSEGIKVDAYSGYIKIEFYNEHYQQTFTIMTKVYKDIDNNYYIRKGIERYSTEYQKWYKLNGTITSA